MIKKKIDFELCTDSFPAVKLAEKWGIRRIELCTALSVGGLTPGPGLIKQCSKTNQVEVHCLIRHRSGDFNYGRQDLEIMQEDIRQSAFFGAKGVVVGCLDNKGKINTSFCRKLVGMAKEHKLEITFHRAIDFTANQLEALDVLIDLGFNRILTSGGEKTAIEGIQTIKAMAEHADNRIEIMAGSGINKKNALQLSETGINSLHFSANKYYDSALPGMGNNIVVDEDKIASIINKFQYKPDI